MRSSVLNFLKSAFFKSGSLKTRIWLVLLEWDEHSFQNSCEFCITNSSLLAESSLYNHFPLSPVPFKWWNFQSSHLGIYLISCFSKRLGTYRLLLLVHFKSQHLSLCFICASFQNMSTIVSPIPVNLITSDFDISPLNRWGLYLYLLNTAVLWPWQKGCYGTSKARAWKWKWKWSRSVVSDSLRPHGLQPTRLLHPWDSPGKSTGVGCHFLLQGIFPTQGSNPGLLHCRQTLYHLSHQGNHVM